MQKRPNDQFATQSDFEAACPNRFLWTAAEVGGVFRIAAAGVLRVIRIGTQRAATARKGAAGRGDRIRRRILFYPVDGRGQKVELIEGRRAAAAMAHAGRKKEAAPVLNFRIAAVGSAHAFVIVDCVFR